MRYMKRFIVAAMLLASFGVAQEKGAKKGGPSLAAMMNLKVADYADGGRIPDKNTCVAGPASVSPAISWSGAPANTASYAVILHDPDAVLGGAASSDVLHWGLFDIAGDAKGLPEGVKNGDQADGAKHISNITGGPGYFGPCAPAGHGDHHYMLEVFALNAKLGLPASTSRADLMSAMNGKVVGKGVYVGIFGRK